MTSTPPTPTPVSAANTSTPTPRKRVVRTMTVTRSERVTPDLVRVHFEGADLATIPAPEHTDSYIKLLFAAPGADYAWPFDPDAIRESHPREQWPVTRTYTIRSLDVEAATMAVDFVVHGDTGLAGPWAAAAKPGDTIGFMGPGGAWSPRADDAVTILVGDESAAPAIAAALDVMPHGARAVAFLEVEDEGAQVPLRVLPGLDVRWVYRRGSGAYGVALAQAVRAEYADAMPDGDVSVFVHGNADMIKEMRRLFHVEHRLPRDRTSISGYWRTGHTEDAWQASKREFVAQMEAEQDAPA